MSVLDKFPKVRPELPPEFQAIYAEHYRQNREGETAAAGIAQRLESWMHRKVAKGGNSGRRLLEIGAGTLNHVPYEPKDVTYDVVEPFEYLYQRSPELARVNNVLTDISEVREGSTYDRIISIAAFEHICDLPRVVAKCGLLLDSGGVLQVGIPSEGTILWRLGYQMSTGLEFRRKFGLDYGILMRHEHVNTAREIEDVLSYFFRRTKGSFFGLGRSLSLYQYFACSDPDLARCELLA